MTIELTTPKGKKIILTDINIGGRIKWEYFTSSGEKKVYYLKVTDKERMVMN